MNTLWLTLIAVGILTFATRASFIFLIEKWQPPALFQRGLRFVPLAVLSAIIVPEVLLRNGQLTWLPEPSRLLGGLAAGFIAWRTRNVFLTIAIGMLVFYLVRFL